MSITKEYHDIFRKAALYIVNEGTMHNSLLKISKCEYDRVGHYGGVLVVVFLKNLWDYMYIFDDIETVQKLIVREKLDINYVSSVFTINSPYPFVIKSSVTIKPTDEQHEETNEHS